MMSNTNMTYSQQLYRDLQEAIRLSVTKQNVKNIEITSQIEDCLTREAGNFLFYCKYILKTTESQFLSMVDYYYGKDTDQCLLELREDLLNSYNGYPLVTELQLDLQFLVKYYHVNDETFKIEANLYLGKLDHAAMFKLTILREKLKNNCTPWSDWVVKQ